MVGTITRRGKLEISMKVNLVISLGILVTISAGCVEDYRAFYISNNLIPMEGCAVEAGGQPQPSGKLDVSLGIGYFMFPEGVNELSSSAGANQPEYHLLQFRRFESSLDLGDVRDWEQIIGQQIFPDPIPENLLNVNFPVAGTIKPGARAAFKLVEIIRGELIQKIKL